MVIPAIPVTQAVVEMTRKNITLHVMLQIQARHVIVQPFAAIAVTIRADDSIASMEYLL